MLQCSQAAETKEPCKSAMEDGTDKAEACSTMCLNCGKVRLTVGGLKRHKPGILDIYKKEAAKQALRSAAGPNSHEDGIVAYLHSVAQKLLL